MDHGADLSDLYGWAAVAAGGMAVLSFAITRERAGEPTRQEIASER